MAGVNKVILIGRLGADPEVRYFESGAVVVKFSIATSESFINKDGNKIENTEWHRVEMWDKLAKTAEQYVKKGDNVYIEGKIRYEQWQDKENNDRKTTKIKVHNMQMLSKINPDANSKTVTENSADDSLSKINPDANSKTVTENSADDSLSEINPDANSKTVTESSADDSLSKINSDANSKTVT